MTTSSWLRLAGRVAVVTGAGSGIGATVAYALATQGCHVVLADKSYEKAEESAKQCPGFAYLGFEGGIASGTAASLIEGRTIYNAPAHEYVRHTHSLPVKCDVTSSQDVQLLIKQADQLAAEVHNKDSGYPPNSLMLDAPLASILVNCAGITRDAFLKDMTEGELDCSK